MDKASLRSLIESKAADLGVDPDLVEAIVRTESSGRVLCARFEPRFYQKYVMNLPVREAYKSFYATSWGLMQIMGLVAYEMGFQGNPVEILDPDLNLTYGIKFLKRKIDKWGLPAAIAAYNAGTPRKNGDGNFVNQEYVDKVLSHLADVRKEKGHVG